MSNGTEIMSLLAMRDLLAANAVVKSFLGVTTPEAAAQKIIIGGSEYCSVTNAETNVSFPYLCLGLGSTFKFELFDGSIDTFKSTGDIKLIIKAAVNPKKESLDNYVDFVNASGAVAKAISKMDMDSQPFYLESISREGDIERSSFEEDTAHGERDYFQTTFRIGIQHK